MSPTHLLETTFLDLRRAAEVSSLSRRTLWRRIKDGRLKAFQADGKTLIKRQDLERLLTSTPVKAPDIDAIVGEVMTEMGGTK